MGQGSFRGYQVQFPSPLDKLVSHVMIRKGDRFLSHVEVLFLYLKSLEFLTGLPRGPLEVKYHQDSELEEQISLRPFPSLGIRLKISSVAQRIVSYEYADDTFKEVWMVHKCLLFWHLRLITILAIAAILC